MGILRGFGLLVAGLAVAALWCVSAAANYAHALHLAQGSDYADIMALASAGADVLKFVAFIALCTAIKKRYLAAVLAAALVWVACAGWSARSGLGFVAITFSDTAAKRGMTASSEKSIAAQIDAETRHLNWLNVQVKSVNAGRELTKAHEAIERSRKSLENLRQQALAATGVTAADPTATFLHDNLGVPEHWTQLGTILWFLLLVEVASNFGPAMLRAFVAKPLPAAAPAPVLVAASNPLPVELPEPVAEEPVVEEPVAEQVLEELVGEEPEPPPPAKAPLPVAKKKAEPKAAKPTAAHSNVLRMSDHRLLAYIATLPVGEKMEFNILQGGYEAHCRRHGVEPMATNQLGAALKRIGVERSRKHGGATYYTRKALAEVA